MYYFGMRFIATAIEIVTIKYSALSNMASAPICLKMLGRHSATVSNIRHILMSLRFCTVHDCENRVGNAGLVTIRAGWRNSIHAPYISAGMRKRLWMRARSYASQSETREPTMHSGKTMVIGR
ncbi:hypothetical protein ALC56_00567 [Trachymyrmex septentrionalis]|uniref:Uncharacterized protein n=1 Tax=Trachymyrmex septentrionalis TaxID=34720 RepID=A0A195FW76_9HYME|nr:hypothetical protein ALC56_00567 [Trachymyrmex septentrionalis]